MCRACGRIKHRAFLDPLMVYMASVQRVKSVIRNKIGEGDHEGPRKIIWVF